MLVSILKISLIVYIFCFLGRDGMIFTFYQKLLDKLPGWIAKPLGKCYACMTGQVLLWYYIIEVRPFNIIDMLFYPAAGIFLSYCYDKLMEWLLE